MKLLVGSPVGRIRSGAPLGQKVVASGGGGVTPIAPDAITTATLESWWKSAGSMYTDDPPTTLAGASDPVMTWTDSSGNGNNSVAETGDKPIYNVSGGLPVATFDGTSLEALASGDHAGFAETDPFSLFAIVNFDSFGVYIPFLGKHDGTSGWHINSSLGATGHLGVLFQGSNYLEVYGNTAMSTGSTYAVVITNSGANAAGLKMWINGVQQTTGTTGAGSWGSINPTNSAPVRLGHVTFAVTAFAGKLGECGIFTGEISSAEAPGLCKYLMNLAGL